MDSGSFDGVTAARHRWTDLQNPDGEGQDHDAREQYAAPQAATCGDRVNDRPVGGTPAYAHGLARSAVRPVAGAAPTACQS